MHYYATATQRGLACQGQAVSCQEGHNRSPFTWHASLQRCGTAAERAPTPALWGITAKRGNRKARRALPRLTFCRSVIANASALVRLANSSTGAAKAWEMRTPERMGMVTRRPRKLSAVMDSSLLVSASSCGSVRETAKRQGDEAARYGWRQKN